LADLKNSSPLKPFGQIKKFISSETVWPNIRKAVSEEKIFRNQPIKNKNCLWRPGLLMDRDKMCNLHRGPSIDASPPSFSSFG
jgi:hypothetical protein